MSVRPKDHKVHGINFGAPGPDITNAAFALADNAFITACDRAGVAPTERQASKYRNKRGAAYKRR